MHLLCDLGTSNVRAAVAGSGEILNQPCVVAVDGTGRMVIGEEAYRMIGRSPDQIKVSRPVEGGVIRNLENVVEMIRYCARTLSPRRLPGRLTLTMAVPSGLTQVERKALEDAGRMAGAREVKLMSAAVAASVGAGLPIESPTGCLVMNLGAGVTEAALLSMKGIVSSNWVRSGGRTMDEAIVDCLKRDYSFLIGVRSAEELKKRIGSDPASKEFELRGRNLRTGLPGTLVVPRSVWQDRLTAYCDTMIDLMSRVISTCPPELVGDIMERGIVFVGGGAYIESLVSDMSRRLEVPITVATEPDTCVIRGLLQAGWSHPRDLDLTRWALPLARKARESVRRSGTE